MWLVRRAPSIDFLSSDLLHFVCQFIKINGDYSPFNLGLWDPPCGVKDYIDLLMTTVTTDRQLKMVASDSEITS